MGGDLHILAHVAKQLLRSIAASNPLIARPMENA
jgi:hypothetical protein